MEFLVRAYAPHLTLFLVLFGAYGTTRWYDTSLPFEQISGQILARSLVITGLVLLAWYLSDLFVTARTPGYLLVPDSPVWGVLAVGSFVTSAICLFTGVDTPVKGSLIFLALDCVLLTAVLVSYNGFHSFQSFIVPPLEQARLERRARCEQAREEARRKAQARKAEQEQREREQREQASREEEKKRVSAQCEAARLTATTYYKQHEVILSPSLSPHLFASYVSHTMGDHVAPDKAWAACHDLIHKLEPIVQEQRHTASALRTTIAAELRSLIAQQLSPDEIAAQIDALVQANSSAARPNAVPPLKPEDL